MGDFEHGVGHAKFRQANEGFDWVFKVKTVDEQTARLKAWSKNNQTVVPLVRLGVGADNPEWNLPTGMPSTIKLQDDMPDGMGDTNVQMEWRRIQTFTDSTSNLANVPQWKREMNWMQILEGLHYKEAQLLTAVKDGELMTLYPIEKLLPGLGITEYTGKTKKPSPAKKKAGTTTKKKRVKKDAS
tara:strand:- start:720 stop:1274 length:555 start_codon:yes stop_codon:yes gene_type:complete